VTPFTQENARMANVSVVVVVVPTFECHFRILTGS